MVVLRKAGNVRVHVPIQLEAARDPGLHERLQGAKDRCPPDARLLSLEAAVQLVGGQLAPVCGQGVGYQQPLLRHALAGCRQSISGCKSGSIHVTTLSQSRLRIMSGREGQALSPPPRTPQASPTPIAATANAITTQLGAPPPSGVLGAAEGIGVGVAEELGADPVWSTA